MSEKCGCKIKYQIAGTIQDSIEFCPLHAAAPELLEACKEALKGFRALACAQPGIWLHAAVISAKAADLLIAAIAKTETRQHCQGGNEETMSEPKCGCVVESRYVSHGASGAWTPYIIYCSLHAAAEDMLDELKLVAAHSDQSGSRAAAAKLVALAQTDRRKP